MNKMRVIRIFQIQYILFLFASTLIAQTSGKNVKIEVLSRVQKDKILLRWAPNRPSAWKLLNHFGYSIERITVSRDNKTLYDGEKKILNPKIFKPEPLENWEEIAQINDNAAVVAQALFGETFAMTDEDGQTDIERMLNKAQELHHRYSLALLLIDQDFEVAQKAGLGFVDTDVKPNEKYLYSIRSLVPKDVELIKPGSVYTGLSEYEPLPEPLEFIGIFKDAEVILSWNSRMLSNYYNNYIIEKSTDSIHFFKLGSRPFTVTKNASDEQKKDNRTKYTDTIQNFSKYYYRIKGVSAFGEIGPPSHVVGGEAKPALNVNPYLVSKKIEDKEVVLTWEFPEERNNDILSFQLLRSDTDNGPYEVVSEHIDPIHRSVTYKNLNPVNYFKISAIGKYGAHRVSFPMLVQPVDNTPPESPTGITGVIDTLGIVKLAWNPNLEDDLMGYRVFIANNPNHEFTLVTPHTITQNMFIDTLPVKNLNTKVYYRVKALDYRANPSGFSETLELNKPDLIPPVLPLIKNIKQTAPNTITLAWAPSSSKDVAQYLVYRKENDATDWELAFNGTRDKHSFTDVKLEDGSFYSYTVIARDRTGLESPPAKPVSLEVRYVGKRPAVRNFYAQENLEAQHIMLHWRYNEKNITQFELYKAREEEPLQLLRTLPAGTRSISDMDLTINTNYTYSIQAVFADGGVSEKSEVRIKY